MLVNDSAVKEQTKRNCDEIVGPVDSCVVLCVNVQCEPVIILNGAISLLCVGLTAEIENIQKKKLHHVLVFSYFKVEELESYGECLDTLQNKSVPTPFI